MNSPSLKPLFLKGKEDIGNSEPFRMGGGIRFDKYIYLSSKPGIGQIRSLVANSQGQTV